MRSHSSPPLLEEIKVVSLQDALQREGFALPEECGNVKLTMIKNGVFILSYDVVVKEADLAKIGRALTRVGEGNLD